MKQIIYSRFEFPIGNVSHDDIFNEYDTMFERIYEDDVLVSGASAAINLHANTAIILTYSEEADSFLRLKFCNRKDVKFNDCRPKKRD